MNSTMFLRWVFAGLMLAAIGCYNATAQVVLQRCDIRNLWEGSNPIIVDTNDKMEGEASLRFTGSGEVWFQKRFSQTNVGIDETGWFTFWLYVSDVTKLTGEGQVELTSSGEPDLDEYSWDVSSIGLSNGWNEVKLQISAAETTGSPSLEAINFFRIYQFLSGEITAKIDFLRFTADEVETPRTDPFDIPDVDFSTLDGKVMFGYQGWFQHPDDGSARARWHHWGTMQDANTISVEMFPDMREYEPDEHFDTGLTFADGRIARVFSSYNKKTVMRHMKWLRDHDLDGVFLQRFNSELRDARLKAVRDTVVVNVMEGCERYGRAFVNMWDLSGSASGVADELIEDWKHLVDNLKITESPNYLHHRGKPLVAIWGFTVRSNLPQADLAKMIDFFKNSPEEKYRASIMLGTNHDFFQRTEWVNLLRQVDVISPWAVGRYGNVSNHRNFINNMVRPGQDWCDRNNVDFLPVIWPGFSWYNLKREGEWQKNQIKRNGGNFFWAQANRVISSNAKMIYIAMFDEVDEATAMFKVAETAEQSPAIGYWLPLNADGFDLPSDWYLRCAQLATEVLRGHTPNRTDLGVPPEGIGNHAVQATHTKCGTTMGKLTFTYPETSAEDWVEFSIDNGETYPYVMPPGSIELDTEELPSGRYDAWVRRGDGSFPTDLGPYHILDVNPSASAIVSDATCGYDDGVISLIVGDNPYMGPIQFSLDGGENYDLTSTEGQWRYDIDQLSPGEYSIWVRYADESCAWNVRNVTVDTQPLPITLNPHDNDGPVEMDGLVIRVCIGQSLSIDVEPDEPEWTWSWSGPNDFSASSASVDISEFITTDHLGRYQVSYVDEETGCNNRQAFFIRLDSDCPPVNTREIHANGDLLVYPNPSDGIFMFEAFEKGIKSLRIVDLAGRQVISHHDLNALSFSVDLSGQNPGVYIFVVEDMEGHVLNGKIIKD